MRAPALLPARPTLPILNRLPAGKPIFTPINERLEEAAMAITVTTSTRLDDIQNLALASETNARLVGKRDGQGNILLYHSQNADPGLWSRLTGRAAEKRALAREAVQQALANTFPSTTATDATLCSVRRMLNANQSREVRAGELVLLAQFASTAPKAGQSWLANAALNPIKLSALEAGFAAQEEGGRHLPAVADHFATYLAGLFKASGADAQAFALGDSRAFKGDLLRHLEEAVGKKHALAKLDGRGVDDFLSMVFHRTASKVLPNGVTGSTLSLNGESYSRTGKVGEGSDGVRVELFTGPKGKQVAVKFFPNIDKTERPGFAHEQEQKRQAAIRTIQREVAAFSSAAAGHHANVLGYEGLVHTPAGEVGIVMEYAPHGTLGNIGKNIAEVLARKDISPKAALTVKVAILRDMVEGMAHLHRKQGLAHLDFKPQNCFVGEGGICKVADFGNSIEAGKFSIAEGELPATFEYVAPEAHGFDVARRKLAFDRSLHDFSAMSSKVAPGDRRMGSDAVLDMLARQGGTLLESKSNIDGKTLDAWALGSAMFAIVFGRDISQCTPSGSPMKGYEVRDALLGLAAKPGKRVIDVNANDAGPQGNAGRLADGAFAGSSGNALVDDLINKLMHPDPEKRLSVDKARNHPLFGTTRGVGSADCRKLLVELAADKPDPAQLKALSRRL